MAIRGEGLVKEVLAERKEKLFVQQSRVVTGPQLWHNARSLLDKVDAAILHRLQYSLQRRPTLSSMNVPDLSISQNRDFSP